MREITLARAEPEAVSPHPGRGRGGTITLRRSLAGTLAVCAAAVVVTLVLGLGGQNSSGPAAFEFQRISQQTVAVRIVNTKLDADVMNGQLRRRGLNVRIEAMPASPQLVGVWLTAGFDAHVSKAVTVAVLAQFDNGSASTVELPVKFSGWIYLGVGVPPKPGQALQVVGIRNALAPNARLGCLHATDGDPATVQQTVEALGYAVTWADGDRASLVPIKLPAAGQRVVAAFIQDAAPAQVQLVVATPGSRRYLPRSRQGYGLQWDTRDSNPSTCTSAGVPQRGR